MLIRKSEVEPHGMDLLGKNGFTAFLVFRTTNLLVMDLATYTRSDFASINQKSRSEGSKNT